MTSSMHLEISNIVGKPWLSKANGPDAFDCWGVVEYVYKLLGIDLGFKFDFDHENHELVSICMEMQSKNNEKYIVKDPQDYDIVMMYEKGRPTHVGLYIDRKVLHAIKGRDTLAGGVCLHNMLTINRMFSKIELYRLP